MKRQPDDGKILSINPQPARFLLPLIRIPALLFLAAKEELFPTRFGLRDVVVRLASAKTLQVVPNAGHSFVLHRNTPATNTKIVDWLAARLRPLPPC